MRASIIFNGKYTIQNSDTGVHRTFRIKTQPKDSRFAGGKRIIGLMTGSDNQSSYTNFGFVDDTGIHVWNRHKGTDYEKLAWMIWTMLIEPTHPRLRNYSIQSSLACLRCNRELTTPESLLSGIGPVCEGRV